MEHRRGTRLAIDDEAVPNSTSTGEATFALSELARRASAGRLVWRDLVVNHARLHTDLGPPADLNPRISTPADLNLDKASA